MSATLQTTIVTGHTLSVNKVEGSEMVSVWLVLAAIVGGGGAVVLVIALMRVTLPEHSKREHGFDRWSL
jgi:hypothetical protein